jgi:general stress protein 26
LIDNAAKEKEEPAMVDEVDTSLGSDSTKKIEENSRALGELIKGIRVAMLTTADPDGILRSRPMATQDLDFDGQLWFFTHKKSGKVDSITGDQHVNVAYVDLDDNRYVSVCGRATLVTDERKIEDLWNPMLKAWFPDGLNDPELALICVDVDSAEYWDAPASAWVQLVGFTKAIITGKRYEGADHHGRVDIRH